MQNIQNIYSLCKFNSDISEGIDKVLPILGVERLSDLDYVNANDLISNGIKVVHARKFIEAYKTKSFKKSPRRTAKKVKSLRKSSESPTIQISASEAILDPPTIASPLPRHLIETRPRGSTSPWISETRETDFSKGFHCLSHYVMCLKENIPKNTDPLRTARKLSFPEAEEFSLLAFREKNKKTKQKLNLSKSHNVKNLIDIPLTNSIIPSCSLMEYDCVISDKDSPLDVIVYIQKISLELNKKIGGAACPANPNILPDGPRSWLTPIKWALPMENFSFPDAPDPDELATWIIEKFPPKDPNAMNSCKGVFMDLDMSFFNDLTRKAHKHHFALSLSS